MRGPLVGTCTGHVDDRASRGHFPDLFRDFPAAQQALQINVGDERLVGKDSIDIARIAGEQASSRFSVQANGNTDVHIRWYATALVDGQPLPVHQDIILNGALLNSFVLGQDYHLI